MKVIAIFLAIIVSGLSTFAASGEVKNITGAFIQLDGQLSQFTEEQWKGELSLMKDIGMDTVIIQYSAYGERFYYPSKYMKTDEISPDESIAELVWRGSTRTRFVKIVIEPTSKEWTMIPEITVKKGGEILSVGRAYTVDPQANPSYPSDGKLTDGAADYAWGAMVGWQYPEKPIEIVIDLGELTAIDSIAVKFMRSEISGVQIPSKGYEVAISSDGKVFMSAGKVTWEENKQEKVNDTLGELLKAADSLDMNVFLGLSLNPSYWSGEFDPKEQINMNQRILTELFNLYGAHASLAGWYLPEEIDDRNFLTQTRKDGIRTYLKSMVTYAKFLTRKPVMISPYFGINPNGEAYAEWWDYVLSEAKVDIIAMQDGVGTRRTSVAESAGVIKALKPIMDKHGVRFWVNVEVFNQIHGWPVDAGSWQAVPADIERVVDQLQMQSPYTEKVVIFDFPHYMTPRLGGKAEELYKAYKEYTGLGD